MRYFLSKLISGKMRIAESSTVIVFRKAWFGLFCTLLDKIDWFDCNHRCSSLARSWSKARGEWAVFPRRDIVTKLSLCITISTENQHESPQKSLAISKLQRKQQIHNCISSLHWNVETGMKGRKMKPAKARILFFVDWMLRSQENWARKPWMDPAKHLRS